MGIRMDSPKHCLVAGYPADTETYFRLWPPALDEETCYLSHVCVVTRRAPANLLFTRGFPPGWLYPRLRSSWGLTTLACSPGLAWQPGIRPSRPTSSGSS